MFAENIIQAALEQVKTTRGDQFFGLARIVYRSTSLFFSHSDYITINETLPPKVKFTTRYVAGTNFLGNRSSMSFAFRHEKFTR